MNDRINNLFKSCYQNNDVDNNIDTYKQFFNIRMPQYLLHKTYQEIFNNPKFDGAAHYLETFFEKFLNRINVLYANNNHYVYHNITPNEYESLLKWLLYCSISTLISSLPDACDINDAITVINRNTNSLSIIRNYKINIQEFQAYQHIIAKIITKLADFISRKIYNKNRDMHNQVRIKCRCADAIGEFYTDVENFIIKFLKKKYNKVNVQNFDSKNRTLSMIWQSFKDSFNNIQGKNEQWQQATTQLFLNEDVFLEHLNRSDNVFNLGRQIKCKYIRQKILKYL